MRSMWRVRANGIERELASLLGSWGRIPVTYAGGVRNFDDLALLRELGCDRLNVTIGSATGFVRRIDAF